MTEQAHDAQDGTLPHAQAIALTELLAIEPAAVVSRVLLRRKTGNITLFTFDRGQGLSEHAAPFDAYVQVLEGELELTIGGKPVRATAGDAVVMPANVPHALQARSPLKMLLVMIRDPS
jgi:quercetin dioxygenase-like cupin family protein